MKTLNRIIVSLIASVSLSLQLLGQSSTISLNTSLTGNHIYTASQAVTLSSGFSYNSQNANTFKAQVLPLSSFNFTEPSTSSQPIVQTSNTVGTIQGNWGVDAVGAATYTIPIKVAPGINGMEPKILVDYNSHEGQGLLGFEWNITDFSTITRVGSDHFHDDSTTYVQFNNSDHFALDGERLIQVALSSGSKGDEEFRTEIESFSRITSYNGSGNSPQYFKVEAKNGDILIYGHTADSQVKARGHNEGAILSWKIDTIYDRCGNFMSFKYYQDPYSGDVHPLTIDYTGRINTNSGKILSDPTNKIKFEYQATDTFQTYTFGNTTLQDSIIKAIDITHQGNTLTKYQFSYNSARTRLMTITESGINGTSLNSSKISWGVGNGSLVETTPVTNSQIKNRYDEDFNNDGITDMLTITNMGSSNATWDLFLCNSTGSLAHVGSGPFPANAQKVYFGDFNGDGKTDIFVVYLNDIKTDYYSYILLSTGTGFTTHDLTPYIDFSLGSNFVTGDFEGIGKDDIGAFGLDGVYYILQLTDNFQYYNMGAGNIGIFQSYISQIDNIPLKVTGDGKTDILVTDNGSRYIYEFHKSGTNYGYLHKFNYDAPNGMNDKATHILLGDFNGDGKTDLICFNNSTKEWEMGFSNGDGLTPSGIVPFSNLFNESTNTYYAADINGDGKCDLINIGQDPNYNNKVTIKVYYSYGNYFANPVTYVPNTNLSIQQTMSNGDYNHFGDFNGDGTADYYYNDGSKERRYTFYKGGGQNFVSTITNGFDFKTTFSYDPLTNSDVYTNGLSESTYPVRNVIDPMYVVSSVSTDNINGTSDLITYNYFWAREHLEGKGFLGFFQISSYNAVHNLNITKQYDYNPTYYNVYLSKIIKFTNGDDSPISTTNYTYSDPINTKTKLSGNVDPFYSYVNSIVIKDYLTGITKTITQSDDDNGNPTDITKTYDDGSYNKTAYSNYSSAGSWMDARPGTITVTKKHYQDANPAVSLTTQYTYHPLTGKDSIVISPDGLETDNHYYGNGNLKSVMQTDNSSHRLTRYDYDALGQFVTNSYNAVGQKTQYTNDYMGNVTSITDPNGLTTINAYDDFGRLTSTKAPNGFITNTTYNWATGLRPSNAVYYTLTTYPSKGLPSVKKYYDWFGKVLRTETTGFDGTSIYTSNVYNGLGQITQSSLPYYAGQQAYAKSYTYDGYGRLTETTDPTNDNIYSYNDKTTQVINGSGQTKTTTTDSQGNILTSTDAGGTVTYTYTNWGKPGNISLTGSSTTIQYDNYGRQQSLTDPDAGKTTYGYDKYNELTSQIDSKGNSYSMAYSVLGRDSIITNNKEGTTNYYYDATGSIGLLSKVTYPGGEEDYAYDTYNRLSGDSKTITDGSTNNKYTFDYKHDIQGRDSIITYPSGITVQNFYNSNGYLYQVLRTDNATLVWKGTKVNALDQYTQSNLGDQLTMTNTYSATGQLTGKQTGSIQNLNYTYNYGNGNLLSRSDAISGLTENFTYDDLNRLTGVNGPSSIATAFDNSGNITSKTSIGAYTYGNQPHAVASVTNPNNLISSTEQDVSYNGFNKVSSIIEGTWNLQYTYDGFHNRTISKLSQSGTLLKTTHYFGNYEKEIFGSNVRQLNYIPAGDGLAAILARNNGKDTIYYVHTDNLGSYDAITNSGGSVLQKYSFDAWGRRRNPTNWTYNSLPNHSLFSRGYTGHEHLDAFNLINMNGRMYDPLLARFLSVDNNVQAPNLTQSYNRYSYCLNNPFAFTDPSGESWLSNFFNSIGNMFNQFMKKHPNSFIGLSPDYGITIPLDPSSNVNINDGYYQEYANLDFNDGGFTVSDTKSKYEANWYQDKYNNIQVSIFRSLTPEEIGYQMKGGGFWASIPSQDFSGFWGGFRYFMTGGIIGHFDYASNGRPMGLAPHGGVVNLPFEGPGILPAAEEGAVGFKSLGAAAKGFSKNILPEGFNETKQFGYQHGQKVYEYMGKYFSKDIDSHNGGVWKVFEAVGGRLQRIGTADETLTIFKR